MSDKKWLEAEKPEKDFGKDWGYPPIILQLLWNRDIKSKHTAEEFLNIEYEKMHNPYLFPDMQKAVDRIMQAKEKNEIVFIFADYDADGIPGGIILYSILKSYGLKSQIYTPHREKEGYGLNNGAIDYMKEKGASLIITCDCGISNGVEVDYAKEKEIDVIVTDHHTISELPNQAYAIIHPQVGDYPFHGLAGGGVAFKIAQAFTRSKYEPIDGVSREGLEKWLLDLASISTVGDMMPLVDENRIIVKYGLMVMQKTRHLGLRKILEVAGIADKELDTYSIGFKVAPRINAAGRMDHANGAIELLISENEEEAQRLAEDLNKQNSARQAETERVIKEAEFQIVEAGTEKEYCLFGFNADWPLGLLGLAAGKISNRFYRPVILMTEIDGKIKGSARSIEEWNIIEALQKISEMFVGFGGHPAAAGMTLASKDNLEEFKKQLTILAKNKLQDLELVSSLKYDMEIELEELTLELAKMLEKLKPYGQANLLPIFRVNNVEVREMRLVGNGEKHLKLTLSDKTGKKYNGIGFFMCDFCDILKVGDRADILFEVSINEWQDKKTVQMKIVDMRKNNELGIRE